MSPPGTGRWEFVPNWLTKTTPTPQLQDYWAGLYRIQEIVSHFAYTKPKKGADTYHYPVTLIWYPVPDDYQDYGLEHLFDEHEGSRFGEHGYVEVYRPGETITTHKRAISDAIPATERANGSEHGQEEADRGRCGDSNAQEQAERGNNDATALGRGKRVRKPTRRA